MKTGETQSVEHKSIWLYDSDGRLIMHLIPVADLPACWREVDEDHVVSDAAQGQTNSEQGTKTLDSRGEAA